MLVVSCRHCQTIQALDYFTFLFVSTFILYSGIRYDVRTGRKTKTSDRFQSEVYYVPLTVWATRGEISRTIPAVMIFLPLIPTNELFVFQLLSTNLLYLFQKSKFISNKKPNQINDWVHVFWPGSYFFIYNNVFEFKRPSPTSKSKQVFFIRIVFNY